MPLLEVAEAENWVQLAVLEVMKIGLMLILSLVIGSCFFFFFFPFFLTWVVVEFLCQKNSHVANF
jgi:hypothetical protein